MRGLVLGFDATLGTGLLRGDDGKRYVFAIDDWFAKSRPRPGQLVDFELHKGMALEIFVIKNAGPLDSFAFKDQFSVLSRSVTRLSKKYAFSAKLLLPAFIILLYAFPFLSVDGQDYSGFNTIGYVRDMLESTGTLSSIGSAETRAVMEAGRGVIYLYLLLYLLPAFAAFKLLRGLQGEKGAERLFVISLVTIVLLAMLPLVMNVVFYVFAPAGNPSLKQSVLSNLSLTLPGAYLNYSWGAVLAFGLVLLGLLDSLRKRRKKADKDVEQDVAYASSAQPLPQSVNLSVAQPQPEPQVVPSTVAPQSKAQPQSQPRPRPAPPRPQLPEQGVAPQPVMRPVQAPVQPQQPQPRPAPVAPQQDAPQQVQNPRPPRPQPQPQPVPQAVAAPATVAVGADDILFDEPPARDERDDISELLKRIREEEGEA